MLKETGNPPEVFLLEDRDAGKVLRFFPGVIWIWLSLFLWGARPFHPMEAALH